MYYTYMHNSTYVVLRIQVRVSCMIGKGCPLSPIHNRHPLLMDFM